MQYFWPNYLNTYFHSLFATTIMKVKDGNVRKTGWSRTPNLKCLCIHLVQSQGCVGAVYQTLLEICVFLFTLEKCGTVRVRLRLVVYWLEKNLPCCCLYKLHYDLTQGWVYTPYFSTSYITSVDLYTQEIKLNLSPFISTCMQFSSVWNL